MTPKAIKQEIEYSEEQILIHEDRIKYFRSICKHDHSVSSINPDEGVVIDTCWCCGALTGKVKYDPANSGFLPEVN